VSNRHLPAGIEERKYTYSQNNNRTNNTTTKNNNDNLI
jgi:hypothetical protein